MEENLRHALLILWGASAVFVARPISLRRWYDPFQEAGP